MAPPKIIFLFSGKRKSGKDYISEKLLDKLGKETATIVRLSGPLKREYASQHGLDYDELLTASHYKERYRQDMIDWGESVRARDPSYFITRAIHLAQGEKLAVWIVSDMRRKSDLEYFRATYPGVCATVRVVAADSTRAARGWTYTPDTAGAAAAAAGCVQRSGGGAAVWSSTCPGDGGLWRRRWVRKLGFTGAVLVRVRKRGRCVGQPVRTRRGAKPRQHAGRVPCAAAGRQNSGRALHRQRR